MKKAIITLSILCGGLLIAVPVSNSIFAQGTNNIENNIKTNITVEMIKELDKEQAKEVLEMRNPNIEYTYQGDENTFKALKEKGLTGYVFLQDVDTDLGLFVEKDSAKVYYFHPSGYLEIAL